VRLALDDQPAMESQQRFFDFGEKLKRSFFDFDDSRSKP
jgi:hypothetical protein